MLRCMAEDSGTETPSNEDLSRMDRKRKGKKLSNKDWESPTDSDAKIARMKDGRTRLAYKPEHAVDLDTGAVVGVEVHPADRGDTRTLGDTLETTNANLDQVGKAPSRAYPTELVADKGISLANSTQGIGRRPLEDAHRGTKAQWPELVARRS